MVELTKDTFLAAVKDIAPEMISSSGQKRDAFTTTDVIPYMRTGIGGEYEAIHTDIPESAKIIVGGIDSTKSEADLNALLTSGDIYPYWAKGKDVAERNADFAAKTLTDNPQPAVAESLRKQADAAADDVALAQSMKMFTVPLGDGQDISVYDPKIKDAENFARAKETLASKFKIDIEKIQGLGDPDAGAQVVRAMCADISNSLDIGTRTDKPVKAYYPDAPIVIDAGGTQWHAGPETAVIVRGDNISTLAVSKIAKPGHTKASDDYIITGNEGQGRITTSTLAPNPAQAQGGTQEVESPEQQKQVG